MKKFMVSLILVAAVTAGNVFATKSVIEQRAEQYSKRFAKNDSYMPSLKTRIATASVVALAAAAYMYADNLMSYVKPLMDYVPLYNTNTTTIDTNTTTIDTNTTTIDTNTTLVNANNTLVNDTPWYAHHSVLNAMVHLFNPANTTDVNTNATDVK